MNILSSQIIPLRSTPSLHRHSCSAVPVTSCEVGLVSLVVLRLSIHCSPLNRFPLRLLFCRSKKFKLSIDKSTETDNGYVSLDGRVTNKSSEEKLQLHEPHCDLLHSEDLGWSGQQSRNKPLSPSSKVRVTACTGLGPNSSVALSSAPFIFFLSFFFF